VIAHLDQLGDATLLASQINFVGIQRPRYRTGTSLPIMWLDVPQMDISSTQLRTQIQNGTMPNFLIPSKVLSFINTENLYRNSESES